MTEHTRPMSLILAALALTLPWTSARADPVPDAEPMPWTGETEHVVCDLSVSNLDRSLSVAAWDRPEDVAVLTVKRAGWYWLFDGSEDDQGALAVSDAAWVRVSNPTNPEGVSAQQNCEREWIADDASRGYLGLFWLEEGRNAVTLHHACPLIRRGVCGDFDQGRPGTACSSLHANRVDLAADSLCAMRTP